MVLISALAMTAILLGPRALGAESAAKCEGGNCPGSVMISGRRVYNYDMRGLQEGRGRVGANMSDYLVWLQDNTTDAQIDEVCEAIFADLGHPCLWKGHPSEGGLAYLDFSALEQEFEPELKSLIDRFPFIDSVEPLMNVTISDAGVGREGPRSWGLDRIDGPYADTDKSYNPGLGADGAGVTVYVLDTGVFIDHEDFEGRAVSTLDMTNSSAGKWECKQGEWACAEDIHGHGTHCAGTIAGKTTGVAKKASIAGVKVLANDSRGNTAWIIGGLDWVSEFARKPAVVSMSLAGPGRKISIEKAINVVVKKGITVVVAAGNYNEDACNFSPAFVEKAITVGSTDMIFNWDIRSSFSNYGKCLDIYAPGSYITSLGTSRGQYESMGGTSMACPHVAGAAALALGLNGELTPDQVQTVLEDWALPDLVYDAKTGSPNLMLYVGSSIKRPNDILGLGSTYKDMGSGKCLGQSKYHHAVGNATCKFLCTAAPTCAGYSVSSYDNCFNFYGPNVTGGGDQWRGPNVRGGGDQWRGAHCYLKSPPPSPQAHVCAEKEGDMCKCNGTVFYGIKYKAETAPPGSGDQTRMEDMLKMAVAYKDVSGVGKIECKHEVFGDPVFGRYKHCMCGTVFKRCAVEGGHCSCDGGIVMYGRQYFAGPPGHGKEIETIGDLQHFGYALKKGSRLCNSGAFGDPDRGWKKQCMCLK